MHTIRLREPWRQTHCQIGQSPGYFEATFTRKFNRPTGLSDGQQVWLAVKSAAATDPIQVQRISLNGLLLATVPTVGSIDANPLQLELQQHLQNANQLVLELLIRSASPQIPQLTEMLDVQLHIAQE